MDESSSPFAQEWAGQTVVSPLGLMAVIVFGILILILPRRYALLPLAIMACLVAPGQRVMILGCNFQLIRLVVLVGWARVLMRGEFLGIKRNLIDAMVVVWAFVGTVAYTALFGSTAALQWRLGNMYDTAGMYFLCRCVIRNYEDIEYVIVTLMVMSVPVLLAFMVESATGHNLFVVFGGVPEITAIREGRLRCQGAFAHPIVAGCFWATLLPLMACRWWKPAASRTFTVVAVLCALVIIVLCASSTPLAAVACCVVGGLLFYVRGYLKAVRWGLLAALVGLSAVTQSPIWHLVARVNLVGGSTGWYRYILIDSAIRHVGEWWLIGRRSMAGWNPQLELVGDVPNELVQQGLRGGLFTVVIFITVLVLCFRRVGTVRSTVEHNPWRLAMVWALGVSLLAHCMNFLGLAYFGQINIVWYFLLASIASLSRPPVANVRRSLEAKTRCMHSQAAHEKALMRNLPPTTETDAL